MAMTLLKARKRPNGSFRIVVHLDASKNVDGEPDPAYVRTWDWSATPQGMTQANYVAQLKAETKLLAQLELDNMQDEAAGTALAGEGTPL